MAGDLSADPVQELGRLLPWESQAVDAVGTAIEFWGFKRNQGRLWALLYLRGRAMAASEIQDELGLSKGAVSMITRELEQWGVLRRVRAGRSRAWHFQAEQDLMAMVARVFQTREKPMVARVQAELAQAETAAQADPATPAPDLDRLARMRAVATLVGQSMELFLSSAQLDLSPAMGALQMDRG